jgi:hypothetical protein
MVASASYKQEVDRAKVRLIREEKGIRAAITAAKKLAK